MLRCVIEIVPFGREEDKRIIKTIYVANVSQCREISNYAVFVDQDPRGVKALNRTCSIRKHRRSDGALVLLKRIFTKLIKKEKDNELLERYAK